MAFTQTDVETLEDAIASGAKVVRMDGREFEYQSIKQMLDALDRVKASVALANESTEPNKPKRPKAYRAQHSGGY